MRPKIFLSRNIKTTTSNIPMIVLTLIVALPILTIIGSLATGGTDLWARLFSSILPNYLSNSISLMGMTAILTCALGISTAWCIAMLDFRGRKLFSWLLILPLASPAYIVGYVYIDIIDYYGPLQSLLRQIPAWDTGGHRLPSMRNIYGAAFVLSIVLYPYIYLMARAAFSAQCKSQWRAARNLGHTTWQAFRSVALPMARPAIMAGLALVLMETLADFGVADYFGVPTFSTGIFKSWISEGDRDAALKLATVMLAFVFVLIFIEAQSRKGQRTSQSESLGHDGLITLSRGQSLAVITLCLTPVLLGFIIPCARLVYHVATQYDPHVVASFWIYGGNSLKLALIVAAISVFIGAALAYRQRRTTSKAQKMLIRLSTLGYALPGALLAISLLVPLGIVDRALTLWLRSVLNANIGLVLSGSLIILIYALMVRFLTVSFNSISSGFEKIPASIDGAAQSLGAGQLSVFRRVHLPLLRPSLLTGAILVFIDVLRELPATLILRPFNFDTLATRVYWLASDERLAQASSAALLITLFGLLPVILLNRALQKTT